LGRAGHPLPPFLWLAEAFRAFLICAVSASNPVLVFMRQANPGAGEGRFPTHLWGKKWLTKWLTNQGEIRWNRVAQND
jgi:hypothetical protein